MLREIPQTFIKTEQSHLYQRWIRDFYNGKIQVLIIKNANEELIRYIGELEEQDLYGKKEVPIGTDNKKEDHVWQEEDMMWHNDRAYLDSIHPFVGLYCKQADEGSSPTYFCDSITAWKKLDDELKQKVIDEGSVEFSVRNYFERSKYPHDFRSEVYKRAFLMKSRSKQSIYRNDQFGEYLFFSPAYAGTDYYEELNKIFEDEENIHVHNWSAGDLVIWNNMTVSHKRDHTPSHVKRRLMRYAFHSP